MLKVLIAYDGSDCSEKALQDLRKAGLPEKVKAVVLTVADSWMDPACFAGYVTYFQMPAADSRLDAMQLSLERAESLARQGAEKLSGYFPQWGVEAEFLADSAVEGVLGKIEKWKPDLVVMGSHGRSAAGRLLFGSVSQAVLTHVHCNLRISRGRDEKEKQIPPVRVMVAYDGSQEAQTAFEAALCRHWPKGTAMRLIAVMDMRLSLAFLRPTGPIRFWLKDGEKDPRAWVQRMLSDQKKRIEEKGLIGYSEVLQGDPKRVLLREAEKWRADAIFVGPRGLTGKERIIAGSVSTALAAHAHCSVEVVHRLWDANVCCQKAHEEHRDCMARQISGEEKK